MIVNLRAVAGTLGALLAALGLALLGPVLVALLYGEPEWWAFAVTAAISLVVGGVAWVTLRPDDEEDLRIREGFTVVALAWLVLSLVGALPWVMTGTLGSYTDAFFETMSGFTTTGATILGGAATPPIEGVPNAFLFWRSLTHWLGGMGIIVLTLAVLPILGIGGMQLFKAEVPGPQADKLTPRVRETAKRLWAIYVGLTAVEVVVLLPAMSLFDAVNHAFATMATGGFSTENGSVGQYDSAYIDGVITLFMFLAGINFALHYAALHGNVGAFWRSQEFRVYTGLIVAATLVMTVVLWEPAADATYPNIGEVTVSEPYGDVLTALRYAAFQAVAIVTTTGFGTADYEVWPALAVSVLFALFFVGGMAGSTGGGVKVVRQVLLVKNSYREMQRLLHPQAILPIRLDHRVVPPEVMRNVLSFIVLYFALIFLGTLVLGLLGLDVLSAFGAAVSSVGNVGPAFGSFGPTENYAHVPGLGKWVLALLMMAGRLEIFTVLVLFVPGFWRR